MSLGSRLYDWWLLLRLHRPAGIWLLLWPILWALWLAATQTPPAHLVLGFVAGTVLLRTLACVAEDLADHLRHPGAERSRDRPLATGSISSSQAAALLALLALPLAALLAQLDRLPLLLALPGLGVAGAVLLAGRLLPLPPVQWSLACACGVPMACAASRQSMPWIEAVLLVAASICWILTYETFYLLSSRTVEARLSRRPWRLPFSGQRRALTVLLLAAALVLLAVVGLRTQRGPAYYAGLSIAAAIALLQVLLSSRGGRESHYRAFLYSSGFGAAVFAGLVWDIAFETYAATRAGAEATAGAAGLLTANSCEPAQGGGYGWCVQHNLTYTPEGWPRAQKMDLYTPRRDGLAPAVIVVYGGDWSYGSRRSMEPVALDLVRRGYLVLNVSQRVAPVFRFPAQLQDMQQAVYWLRHNAQPLHADPQRLAAWGYSSGAQVAAMLGTVAPDDPWGAPGIALRALVTEGLPSDLSRLDDAVLPELLGATREQDPALYRRASPLYHVSPRAPATFLYSGRDDNEVPPQQSVWMRDALLKAGVPVVLKEVPGQKHGRMAPPVRQEALDFLDGVMRP